MPSSIVRFLNQVSAQPDHPAFADGARTLTFGKLGEQCRRLAGEIAAINPQPRVAIMLPPGPDLHAACLATLMAGGFYAPLNPRAPAGEKAAILRKFSADVLIADPDDGDLDVGADAPIVLDPSAPRSEMLERPRPAHRLAMVRFTTVNGRPNGVMIPRSAIDGYVGCILRESGITPEDRWSCREDSVFDVNAITGLCGGATLVPAPRSGAAGAVSDELRVTVWNTSASDIEDRVARNLYPDRAFDSLRLVILDDDAIRRELITAIFEAHPNITLLRTYGESGAAIPLTFLRLQRDNYGTACQTTVAIGTPLDNMSAHLVGGKSPEEGELAFSGPQLAAGYWNDPDTTRKSFRPLHDGGPIAFFTSQWAERSGQHIYALPFQDAGQDAA